MINGGMMKMAVYALKDSMKQVGREVNVSEIVDIVEGHALTTAVGAATSGIIPGAGGTIAFGIACTSTIAMYGRLASVMGVHLNKGLIRAVASAIVADLAASVAATFTAAAALSFFPGVGSMAASTLTAITNYGFVYLAGLIFIKMVAAMGITRMECMSEEEIKEAAKNVQANMDIKKAMKEAKQVYNVNS